MILSLPTNRTDSMTPKPSFDTFLMKLMDTRHEF